MMRYVLLIPGWFPSKVDFLAGDFIDRHAKAASLYFPVKVLFVVKDNSLPFGKILLDHKIHSDNYETYIYYYSARSPKAVQKLSSIWLQAKSLAKGFSAITKAHGLPSLIHAHVVVKHAWFALKKAKQYRIPLLASEQWTGYLAAAENEIQKLSSLDRKMISAVFSHADHLTTVSEYLAQEIRRNFNFKSYSVIPNVVDTTIFSPAKEEHQITTFVHISTLSYQKNFDEILQACVQLKKLHHSFQLIVFSPHHKSYFELVNQLGLNDVVFFRSEVPQQALSKQVAKSDALILYSNYETFGCVVVEANACGIPVIVSDFPVFDENVQENVTGFKVPLHQPELLAERMLKIINKQHSFDKKQIVSITRAKYSFEVIGKQFAAVYNRFAKP